MVKNTIIMNLDVKIGDKFYYYDKEVWHVLSVISDKGSKLLVIKSWAKRRFRWIYKVVNQEDIEYWLKSTEQIIEKNGRKIIKAKKRKDEED